MQRPTERARQQGETNLDDGGELTREAFERVLRNGANDGSLVLKSAQPCRPGSLALERMQKDAEQTRLGVSLVRCRESKMNIPDYGERKEKMKTRFSFALALVFGILAGTLPMTLVHGQATPKVVLQTQFKLTLFPKPASLISGERLCPFFLWTKDFTSEQRISFNYVDKAGMTTSNVPVLGNVTIIINPKDSVPVAVTDSPLESNEKVWEINMSQDTYTANAKCLEDISVKNAH